MSKVVYVSNMNKSHDYTSAELFGVLRPVTTGNYPVFKTARLIEEIIESLIESSQEDYLLVSGSSIVAALSMTVWLTMHEKVNILLFDRSESMYTVRVLERKDIGLEIERTIDRRAIAEA